MNLKVHTKNTIKTLTVFFIASLVAYSSAFACNPQKGEMLFTGKLISKSTIKDGCLLKIKTTVTNSNCASFDANALEEQGVISNKNCSEFQENSSIVGIAVMNMDTPDTNIYLE